MHAEDADHSVRVDIADTSIRSNHFWAYAEMVKFLGDGLLKISGWAEGCPCHTPNAPTRHQRGASLRQRAGVDACPMAGRRAPECATGDLIQQMERMLTRANTDLLRCPSMAACSDRERADIMLDFSSGRRFILLVISVKASVWQTLPWLLFGCAHHDVTRARACARRALRVFPASGCRHWTAQLFCNPAGAGYAELRGIQTE